MGQPMSVDWRKWLWLRWAAQGSRAVRRPRPSAIWWTLRAWRSGSVRPKPQGRDQSSAGSEAHPPVILSAAEKCAILRSSNCASSWPGTNSGGHLDAVALLRRASKRLILIDVVGRPFALTLTPGNVADITAAPLLARAGGARYVLADKGYDADALRQTLRYAGPCP